MTINGAINGDNKNELKRWFTPQDTLQTIDMPGCILTGFVKKTQYNALNIKSVAKQVWFYFLIGTTRSGYAGTITNLQIVLNTPNPYLNQAPQKNPEIKNFKPQKILRSTLSLKIRTTPPPPPPRHNVPTRKISNFSFVLNLNNSQNVYKQISSFFIKHFE